MNISWVLADSTPADPTVDIDQLKQLGAFWGSWRTWRAWQTDNVICHDQLKADELIKRNFQNNCNFYIPNSVYTSLARPDGVRLYEGAFVQDVAHQEEIVAMHLASSITDIVLLLGFDITEQKLTEDRLRNHQEHYYRNLVKQAIVQNSTIQWVIIDHLGEVADDFKNLENLQQDTLKNILS